MTGAKYVGSSNSLSRRLDQYFTFKHFNQSNSGLLIPLLKKDGFEAFSLEVFVIPDNIGLGFKESKNLNFDYTFLFLEQFYLLHDKFNLNTQRIVNFRTNQGKAIYLYSLDGEILYYSASSLNGIKGALGLHPATCTSYIKTGNNFLDFFKISNIPLEYAKKTQLSLEELLELMDSKKKEALLKRTSVRFSKAIIVRKEGQEQTLEFPSIVAAVRYLDTKNIYADRNKIAKHLGSGLPYKGYIFSKA